MRAWLINGGSCWRERVAPCLPIDSLLAATALHHNLVLVTRNLKDVAGLPVTVLNPWEAEVP